MSTPITPESISSCLFALLTRTPGDRAKENLYLGHRRPPISVPDYIARLWEFCRCTDYHWVVAILYIQKWIHKHESHVLSSRTVHRIVLASIVCAIKYVEEDVFVDSYYAEIGGVPISELIALQWKFASELEFELYVNPDIIHRYYQELTGFGEPDLCETFKKQVVISPTK